MIRIFYCQKNSSAIPEVISEYRKNKILAANNEAEKIRMLCAAEVLRAGFESFGIAEEKVIYAFGENGKPFAQNHPEVKFSLSHTENFAVAAFSDGEVGIDCERSGRSVSERVQDRYFGKKEKLSFAQRPILLWTAKESISKLEGNGVSGFSHIPELDYFTDTTETNGIRLQCFEINGFTVVVSSLENGEITVLEVK